MANFIVAGILLIIIGAASIYIIQQKKNGVKCIGCPAGCHCAGKNNGHSEGCCGCHSDTKEDSEKQIVLTK